MDAKTKITATLAVIFAGLGLLLILSFQNWGKFRLIACDVGQGDGMLLVSPSGKQIVVDGGPGTKIADCLGQNMPFSDRTVELVVLTHAEKDHIEGLLEVLARYKVKMVVETKVNKGSGLYLAWQKAVENEKAKVYVAKSGDRLSIDTKQGQTLSLDILWPDAQKLSLWQASPPSDLNESAIVMRVTYGSSTGSGFCAYLTGDIPKETLQGLIDRKCQVLKISHHGSKTGTNEEILNEVSPRLAIIQVGKNSYGHPTKEIIDLLTSNAVKILRNDTNGIIEITSDGKSFKAKSEK
ncbi:hypothetical protein A2W15_00940 [Candidatus Woesebacteria bacterium RBG_16_41_13]|nr:MAG: hypothetical protein A2W15_00940 [Candidatus Woesebacteria bacterium RBG_16_41_13]